MTKAQRPFKLPTRLAHEKQWMRIPEHIIQRVQLDPLEGVVEACRFSIGFVEEFQSQSWTVEELDLLLETYALISAMREADLIEIFLVDPNLSGLTVQSCPQLLEFIQGAADQLASQAAKNKLESLKKHFAVTVTKSFGYEFTDGDLARVQALLNELRELVASASDIDEEHRQRLLKRLEQLQSELHKKTSDLSRFYGLLGEAGVVLGKFGEDAKPIVDRVKEIIQITWRTQSRAEELPSGTTPPLLEKDPE